MLSLAHTIISLPLAIYLDSPLLIIIAGIILHHFLDTLTHWNLYPDQFTRYPYELVVMDFTGGLLIAWAVTGSQFFSIPVLAAIFGGNLPDILHGLWDFLPPRLQQHTPALAKRWLIFHNNIQLETESLRRGLPAQIILCCLAAGLVLAQ